MGVSEQEQSNESMNDETESRKFIRELDSNRQGCSLHKGV